MVLSVVVSFSNEDYRVPCRKGRSNGYHGRDGGCGFSAFRVRQTARGGAVWDNRGHDAYRASRYALCQFFQARFQQRLILSSRRSSTVYANVTSPQAWGCGGNGVWPSLGHASLVCVEGRSHCVRRSGGYYRRLVYVGFQVYGCGCGRWRGRGYRGWGRGVQRGLPLWVAMVGSYHRVSGTYRGNLFRLRRSVWFGRSSAKGNGYYGWWGFVT